MCIRLCLLRYLRFCLEEHEGIPNLWPQPRKGALPRELKEELGEPSMWWTRTAQKPPPPRSGHFLFGQGQPARSGNERTNIPEIDERPTTQPNLIDERFPLTRPRWDFERAKGTECLRVYRQTLKARNPTNLAKVNLVRQEPNGSPAAFLERLMEAFRQYTPWTHRPMSHARQLC